MIIAYGTVSCFFADDFLPCQTLSTNSPSVLLSDLQYAIMPPVSLCMPPPFSCLALEPSPCLCLGLPPSSFELFFNSIFDIISLTILFHAPCFVFFQCSSAMNIDLSCRVAVDTVIVNVRLAFRTSNPPTPLLLPVVKGISRINRPRTICHRYLLSYSFL